MQLRLHQFSVERGAKGCQIYCVFIRVAAVATVTMMQTGTQRSLQKNIYIHMLSHSKYVKIKNKMEEVIAG